MTKLNEMSYGELIEHVDDVIRALRIKAYGEGYEQGRFEQRLESELDDVTKETEGELPQDRRDKIVNQAKGDIELLKDERFGLYIAGNYVCTAEFIVNKDKRTIVALLRGEVTRSVRARGIAKCSPTDCFNVHIGKAIALRRALGLEVPDVYLNAPQPTEKRIGDIVEYKGFAAKIMPDKNYDISRGECAETSARAILGKIVDDSREGVTE